MVKVWLRRLARLVEWHMAQPVATAELQTGDRVLLRDGSVLTVVRVRSMPEPPAWAALEVRLVAADGTHQTLYQQPYRVMRRAPATRARSAA